MKILAFDHRTARYEAGSGLLSCTGFHADRLLHALLDDLSRLQDVDVTLLRDPSLAPLNLPASVHVIACAADSATETMAAGMAAADAVWPVVPESTRMLERASSLVLNCDRMLIGSQPGAVRVAASKHATSQALKAAGVAVVDTCRLDGELPECASAWVVKPDDGAGCSETRIFADGDAARGSIARRDAGRYVMQPYLHGAHRSISMVCADSRVLLMSVNDQRMAVYDNQLHYMGSTVNGVRDQHRQYRALAEQVLAALPGLWGYVGIDFIMGADGPVVLEVNPRVTISHAGMRQSTGHNPAQLLLELMRSGKSAPLEARRIKPVSIDINPFPEAGDGRPTG